MSSANKFKTILPIFKSKFSVKPVEKPTHDKYKEKKLNFKKLKKAMEKK